MVLTWDPVAALTAYGLDTTLLAVVGIVFGIGILTFLYRKVKTFLGKA